MARVTSSEPGTARRPAALPAGAALPHGFLRLIAAQFVSALADNALLILAIAWLAALGQPGWWAPLLKFSFTLSYVLLAPVVGPLADAWPKTRLMAWMNALKLLGVLALALQVHPVAAYALVGLGAAGYAPAKYGLITEWVRPELLVRANGWIEVCVVCAALFGTVLGGLLVSPGWLQSGAVRALLPPQRPVAEAHDLAALTISLAVIGLLYAGSAWLQRAVPDSGVRYPAAQRHPRRLLQDFRRANRQLWADPLGGLSLSVTTLFWGVGATLQFAVLRWAGQALGLSLAQAAYLQAVVAVGVMAGAALAGRFVPMSRARSVLPVGVLLGLGTAAAALVDQLHLAIAMLALVGAIGGVLVVPMNALLQHRGHQLLTAGRSIAVQGYNENLSILVMLSAYAALVAVDVDIVAFMVGFGLLIAAAMAALMLHHRHKGVPP